jgi:hypothetical protein
MGAIAPGKSYAEQQESIIRREDERDVGSMDVRISRGLDKHPRTKIAAWERMMANSVWDDRQLP